MGKEALKKHRIKRKTVQILWGILSNGYLKGFVNGTIYQGSLKNFCVPGMNCYSCPGALGSCPIGAMQAVFDGKHRKFAFYVVGYLAIIGLIVGRFVCGWLCLFGLIQELLYKIPAPKLVIPAGIDKIMRYFKYAVLAVIVFALPFFFRDKMGIGEPFFCKFLCPVGTLEGGIPLLILNEGMRAAAGALFRWKFLLLIICLLSSIFIYRPFCKYICPLGAFYALFNKVSIIRMTFDESKCINCSACSDVCKMNVDPRVALNSTECIRCGECIKTCPVCALSMKQRLTGAQNLTKPNTNTEH